MRWEHSYVTYVIKIANFSSFEQLKQTYIMYAYQFNISKDVYVNFAYRTGSAVLPPSNSINSSIR